MCYTYDSLSRVTNRTIKNECNEVVSSEAYSYDAAGNVTQAPESCFVYDANNRLVEYNTNTTSYDADGNMTGSGAIDFEYDSANRLVKAGGHAYTYNAEDVRIRYVCGKEDTTYTYNTNCKLSQLLEKTTNGVVTKYVYGMGLIGEECEGEFKTYHFDSRGSTVAITNEGGNITDTFKYDTYGNEIEHIGDSSVIFGYNGRDGVVTDKNTLIYMRARYYSPDMRRFVNADILHGEISDSTSLNRYSYVNGNPVSFVDPFGLVKERSGSTNYNNFVSLSLSPFGEPNSYVNDYSDGYSKERWYGPDGKAIKDRHHTDHGNPKQHSDPHDQYWGENDKGDWTLGKKSYPPSDSMEEPTENSTDEKEESSSSKSSTNWQPAVGAGLMLFSIVGIIWIIANDVTGVGLGDDWGIAPATEGIRRGWQMMVA